ncbi:MAG: ATP synthase F0 subunit B [Candidatus Acidiferrum sp.]
MKRYLMTILRWSTPALILFCAVAARAAEEGASPAEQSFGYVFKWIHFLIIAIAVYWLFKKILPPYIRRNADKISAAITKATAVRAEAERQLKEAAAKLTTLEQEIHQFREQAQKDAAAELERLRAIAKTDIEKVSIAATAEIEAAERAARVELKALAAKLAVDRAESLVAQQMTPSVQDAMINNFVQSLQGRPN